MPVCGYVVVPRAGARDTLIRELAGLDGCEVTPAENADVLLLVTDTDSFDEDVGLRGRIEELPSIQALFLTFGEIDPHTPLADPLARGRGKGLPVLAGEPVDGPGTGVTAPRQGGDETSPPPRSMSGHDSH